MTKTGRLDPTTTLWTDHCSPLRLLLVIAKSVLVIRLCLLLVAVVPRLCILQQLISMKVELGLVVRIQPILMTLNRVQEPHLKRQSGYLLVLSARQIRKANFPFHPTGGR